MIKNDEIHGRKCFSKSEALQGPGDETTDEERVIIQEKHERPYIGDFPPKDDYKKDVYL